MFLLAIDISDTFIGQGGYGSLQLTNQQRGILIGMPSMILFFVSFGIGLPKVYVYDLTSFSRRHSRISFQANRSIIRVVIIAINRTDTFVQGLIGTGCVIIGLGIFRAARRQ